MPYDSLISRADAQSMIPEEVSSLLLENLQAQSAAMQMFTRLPMATNQTRMPILAALPTAYWVQGDTGLKQTTELAWANKYISVEEIAAIIPIPENVLDDAGFPIWATVRPLAEQAIARVFDAAVFFGVNKPASFPDDIVTGATAAGNTRTLGTATQAQGGFAEDVNQAMVLLEAEGYEATAAIARTTLRGRARSTRATTGEASIGEISATDWWGAPVTYPMRGMWPTTAGSVQGILGDFTKGVVGFRSDITWKLLDQAAIFDSDGQLMYNLPQQDMVAMRVTTRLGFTVANPINYDELTEADRYPFALLLREA